MINLDKLEAMAKAATPGPWFYQDESDAYTHIVRPVDNPGRIIASGTQTSDARGETTGRFIAAANPSTVLELIAMVREPAVVSIPVIKEGTKRMPMPCGCRRCLNESGAFINGMPATSAMMVLCSTCGSKRCPHANDHRHACTDSNEPGQAGSAYAAPAAPVSDRQKLILAAIDTGHSICDEEVVLVRDESKPGNALSQLGDRLAANLPATAPVADTAQQWIKNTGAQLVADDVLVSIIYRDGGFDTDVAGNYVWELERDDVLDVCWYLVLPAAPAPGAAS